MKSEFSIAINQICSERNLPQEVIFEAIESALVSAYKRNFGGGQNIKATFDMQTGVPHVFLERIVVEAVEDDRFELTLDEAVAITPGAEMGSLIREEITPRSFGRIAAQTAKQVILQRIREAERDALYTSFADREGELINGMVANVTAQALTLNLGRTEAIMPRSQQVPGERYRIGQRIRAYVMEVKRTNRGPQIIVSRTHRHMLRRLIELEVPEVFSGTVEIKSIAREAGSRSKVAVAALQDGVDPVGSCVGIRGMRIQSIVNELGGEKIDVVGWSADTGTFIANALSPAKVSYVLLGDPNANSKTATVVVPDDQLSLAIGKAGQNARLSAKLTGWRIDIKSAVEADREGLRTQQFITLETQEQRDILAMAEAILMGKQPVQAQAPGVDAETPETELVETEEEVPVAATSTPTVADLFPPSEPEEQEEPAILAAAEVLLRQQEPQEQTVEEGAIPAETAVAAAVAAVETEPEVAEAPAQAEEGVPAVQAPAEKEPEPELVSAEIVPLPIKPVITKPEPEAKPKPKRKPGARYEYVKDEQLEALETPKEKARRKKRRQLVLDEETGELISQRKHKNEDDAGDIEWEGL